MENISNGQNINQNIYNNIPQINNINSYYYKSPEYILSNTNKKEIIESEPQLYNNNNYSEYSSKNEDDKIINNHTYNFVNTKINQNKKNIDKNIIKKIDKNMLSQFMYLKELENEEKIKELENEKKKLNKENKKLLNKLSLLNKNKEKLNYEKKLFLEDRNKVINDLRQNEENLIKLENDIQSKFYKKKDELTNMQLKLRNE
jgi:hypothetical protein